MSKLTCICGHVIIDQKENLPYKGEYIADQDYEQLFEEFFPFLSELIVAREQGRINEFLERKFTDRYPKDSELQSIIGDAFPLTKYERTMYECEVCGRLWIETETHSNNFVSYLPETPTRGIFKSQRKTQDDL